MVRLVPSLLPVVSMSSIEARQDRVPPASDAGGVAARQGFKYQDHVAAHFVLRMIASTRLLRVECETADDILLVWSSKTGEQPEYVQVKTTEGDRKWSLTEVCQRDSGEGAKRPTSLIEKSLLCDCHGSDALFRIVSRRDVGKALSALMLPLERRSGNDTVADLAVRLAGKWKTTSPNCNDLAYWARNAVWQVTGDMGSLEARNQQALSLLAEQYGANPTHGHVCKIYEDLLELVDRAATASRITAADQKVISRPSIMDWWAQHLEQTAAAARRASKPYRAATSGFLAELHHVTEDEIRRALTGYDVRYELRRWRSEQLADYLADWLPEVSLKASELVEVQHLNLRQKLQSAFREIERHREIDINRLLAEMLLHAVLRHRFQSEPIACKLFYRSAEGTKTFGNAHVIHGSPDELWLGRGTLATHATYDDVLASIVSELESVLDPDFLKNEREVILTLREPDHLLPTTLEDALNRNTPIDDLLEVLCIPILIGYDSDTLKAGFSVEYRDRLTHEVKSRYEAIKPTLPAAVETIKIHVFLVPIECVTTLARQFEERIKGT